MAAREEPLLESWKEIADYLKRSVRTCRRWEAELGLPIHRLDGTPRARVFAYHSELDRWLSEKLHHLEAEEPRFGPLVLLKKRKMFLIGGTAALLAALGGALAFFRAPAFLAPTPVPGQNPVLVILPLEDVSGDKDLGDWRTALPDLLVNDLRQSRYINVVPLRRVFLWLQDKKLAAAARLSPDDAAAIAKTYQADFTANGKIEKAGDRIAIEISIRAEKTPGLPPQALRLVVSDEQALLYGADGLSRDIKKACGLTRRQLQSDVDESVRRIATASPEAMKLYARADLPAQWGPLPDTGPAIEKALVIDPGFALAHALMVSSYGLEHVEDHVRSYEKALALANRLSERERLLLQASFYHFYRYQGGFTRLPETGVPPSTIARLKPKTRTEVMPVLERLADLYPDFYSDSIHLTNLVRIYQDAEEWDKAIAVLEKVAPLTATRMPVNTQTLIRCYLARGLTAKAEEAVAMLEKANPARNFGGERREIAMAKHQHDAALALTEKQFSQRDKTIPPPYMYSSTRGYFLWLADDLVEAEKAYRSAAGNEDASDQRQRAMDLTVLYLSQGKISLALDEARKGLALAEANKEFGDRGRGRDHHHLLAYLLRLSGRLPEALKEAEEACRDYQSPDVPPGLAVALLHMRALITLELNLPEFGARLEEIRETCQREQCPKFMRAYHYLKGVQELRRGNGYKALAELERARDLTEPRTRQSDPAHILFALADVYESLGNVWTAAVNLEEIAAPFGRASFTGDVYALSFYRKAKIYEGIMKQAVFRPDPQSRAKAIEGYKKFLGLWGDADPLFAAQVNDARQRLAALEAQ